MIQVRRSSERGHFNHGWLDTYHTFSFADYHDPAHMSFRSLRVLNEDRVAAGHGFGMHPHRDMEILTCMVSGSLQHRDSLGTGSIIHPGEWQRITAGTGVQHSEVNPSRTEATHLLQIWITPERRGLQPGYEQKSFPEADRRNRLQTIATPDGRDGSLTVHQDVVVYRATLDQPLGHAVAPGRHAWIQVISGEVAVQGETLYAGDAAAVSDEPVLAMHPKGQCDLLLFDLA